MSQTKKSVGAWLTLLAIWMIATAVVAPVAVPFALSSGSTAVAAEPPAVSNDAQNEAIAREALKFLVENADKAPEAYGAIIDMLNGHHTIHEWRELNGKRFIVLKLKNHDGSRMGDSFNAQPCKDGERLMKFTLLNVRPEDISRVYWKIKSDVAGRGDGNRQVDNHHKTRSGDSIWINKRAKKDRAYYPAGRWKEGLSEKDFFARNPDAALLIELK